MAKKEKRGSKNAEEQQEDDERDDDEGYEAPTRKSAAEERRARMRERRSAASSARIGFADRGEDHDEDDHGHDDHGHDDHGDDEDEIDTSNDPTWWAPHGVLGALVLIGILGFFGTFNGLAAKLGYYKSSLAPTLPKEEPAATSHTETPPAPPPRPTPPTQLQPPQNRQMFAAKHLLVMYKGSMRAPANVTRTKEEAKARAEEALKKAKAGTKFEELVKEYSDEPGAAQRGGDLGRFPKGRMVGAFQDGLEKTKVGGVSDLVETPFGYHVIYRTE